MDEPKRRWMYVEFDEDIHRELCKRAVELGTRPVDLMEQFTIDALEQMPDAEKSWNTKMFLLNRKLRERERNRSFLRQLAWHCLQEQSEGDFDTLTEMCKEMGLTVESVLGEVRDAKAQPITFESDRGVKSAMAWLTKSMKTGEEYIATEIMENANANDYTAATVNHAKRELGIKSVRRSGKWLWIR